ncbi:hypothetical protein [Bradyrhizobium sp. SK17]|uniref:hypothetical protein n=1 Tax=Bradyrhizobium sp. SK17 TaxID=2057741 RepID=UPI0012FE5106|nr:hypothetical protein [Bradyrhizobium sp. SK17]
MSNRSAKFAAALAASIMAGANFGAMAQNAATTASTGTATARTADSCQSAPKGTAPAGSHWFYHLDRSTQKKCWYLGDARNKVAKTAVAQPAAVPDTATADATPPQGQPAPPPAMRKSIADARAEWPSPQAGTAPSAVAGAGQADSAAPIPAAPAAPPEANAQSSDANARWLDASSMAGTNGTRHAADQPTVVAQADATPQQAAAPAPAVPVAAETPAEKSASSTQMLLFVMVGALALAGLVSALVFRLTRTRTPPYEISDEWRAPWDSLHTEPAPPMAVVNRDRPLRLSEATPRRAETQVPRRAETPAPRREIARKPDQTEQDNQQIAAMLQRLARSAAN